MHHDISLVRVSSHKPISLVCSVLCVIVAACATQPADSGRGTMADTAHPTFVTPHIEGYGAIMPFPVSAGAPRAGSRVVFDISAAGEPDQVVKGLDSIALFLNLAAEAGVPPETLRLVAVFHGPATNAVLRHQAYAKETQVGRNPNVDLIQHLTRSGVEIYVCGQALARRRYSLDDVVPQVKVTTSASTVTVNKQIDGYAYLPFH